MEDVPVNIRLRQWLSYCISVDLNSTIYSILGSHGENISEKFSMNKLEKGIHNFLYVDLQGYLILELMSCFLHIHNL